MLHRLGEVKQIEETCLTLLTFIKMSDVGALHNTGNRLDTLPITFSEGALVKTYPQNHPTTLIRDHHQFQEVSIYSACIGIFSQMAYIDCLYIFIDNIDILKFSLSQASQCHFNGRTNAFLADPTNWMFFCNAKLQGKRSVLEADF